MPFAHRKSHQPKQTYDYLSSSGNHKWQPLHWIMTLINDNSVQHREKCIVEKFANLKGLKGDEAFTKD